MQREIKEMKEQENSSLRFTTPELRPEQKNPERKFLRG
jgi:hypothetical protein